MAEADVTIVVAPWMVGGNEEVMGAIVDASLEAGREACGPWCEAEAKLDDGYNCATYRCAMYGSQLCKNVGVEIGSDSLIISIGSEIEE